MISTAPVNDALVAVAALARLTPGQREAYVDHIVLERTHTEIATRMGITRSRVGSLIKTAKQRMDTDPLLRRAA